MPKTEPGADQIQAARDDPKLANVLYHNWAAHTYEQTWSISYDERSIEYVRDCFMRVSGTDGLRYEKVLELGCGTGFFLLNLKLAGVLDNGYVTDISPGMVEMAKNNAEKLGFSVEARVADAERIPYEDNTFDLVVGHAVLHHLPDVGQAMREVLRVLKPGGRFVFAGEPTEKGDWVVRRLSLATWWVTSRIIGLPALRDSWSRPKEDHKAFSDVAALESLVDLHTFDPDKLVATCERAGALEVRTQTDELAAAWFGWSVGTFEVAVKPGKLGQRWRVFADSTRKVLHKLDREVFTRVVPARFFYNVSVTGIKPS